MIKYLRNMIQKHYLTWWRSLIGSLLRRQSLYLPRCRLAIDGVLESRRGELNHQQLAAALFIVEIQRCMFTPPRAILR